MNNTKVLIIIFKKIVLAETDAAQKKITGFF